MGDPLGLFTSESARRQQPQRPAAPPDDPLGLFATETPDRSGRTGDIDLGALDAPAVTPAPRQPSLLGTVRDWWKRNAPSAPFGNLPRPDQTAMNPAAALVERQGTALVPVPDSRTPEQKHTDQMLASQAEAHRLIGEAASPDATAAATERTMLTRGDEATKRHEIADAQAHSTPRHWEIVADKGDQYAAQLDAEGKHDEAAVARAKATNARRVAESKRTAEPFARQAVSSFFAPLGDPFQRERENLAEADAGGVTFSPDEQRHLLGIEHPATAMEHETAKEFAAGMAGQLPWFVVGGAVERAALGAAGKGLMRAGATEAAEAGASRGISMRLGERLTRAAEGVGEQAGPQVPAHSLPLARARIAEEAASLRASLPRAMTEGQATMAVTGYASAREQGASPEEALTQVANAIVPNMGMVAANEAGIMFGGRVLGLTFDPIGHRFVRPAMEGLDRAARTMRGAAAGDESLAMPVDRRADVNLRRHALLENPAEIGQELPDPTQRRQDIGSLLESLYTDRRAGRQAELEQTFADPDAAPINRTALDLADANVGMRAHAELQDRARAEAEATEAHPLMQAEREAQARPGAAEPPIDLGRTIEAAEQDRQDGNEDATAYHQAINDYVDAAVAIEDTPEGKQPKGMALVRLARAKSALNDARKRYGAQLGASAVLGLAVNDDDLTDEEKKWVGLAGVAVLGTEVTKAGEHVTAPEYRKVISDLRSPTEQPGVGNPWGSISHLASPAEWAVSLRERRAVKPLEADYVTTALRAFNKEKGEHENADLTREEVADALERAPRPSPLVSRVRMTIEQMPGKRWDQPVPAADWIGKLKGTNTFSRAELDLLLPALEGLQREKTKVSRADLLQLADSLLPQMKRTNLMHEETPRDPHSNVYTRDDELDPEAYEGDRDNVVDVDDVLERGHGPEIAEQIANRNDAIATTRRYIDDETERFADNMNSAESRVDSYFGDIRTAIEEEFPDSDVDAAMNAIDDVINDDVTSDHVPRGTVQKAMDAALDHISSREAGPDEPTPEDGYSVEESIDGVWQVVSDYDGQVQGEGATRTEAINDAYRTNNIDFGADEPLLPDGYRVEDRSDHPRTSSVIVRDAEGNEVHRYPRIGRDTWTPEELQSIVVNRFGAGHTYERVSNEAYRHTVVAQDGRELGHGTTREEAIRDAMRYDPRSEGDWDRLRSEIDAYASAKANYLEAESQHHYADEGEYFEGEYNNIAEWENEIIQLGERLAEIRDDRAVRETAGEPESESTPADEEQGGIRPLDVEPPVHGRPKYSSYQRIGGGTNYRELLTQFTNNPVRDYKGGHYGEYPNTVAHARVEDHDVVLDELNTPGALPINSDMPWHERDAREQINTVRQGMKDIGQKMAAIVREYETLPASEKNGSRAYQLANEYAQHNTSLAALSEMEQQSMARIRSGNEPTKTVAVMIESQSDLAQEAAKYGTDQPPLRAEDRDRIQGEINRVQHQRDALLQRWSALGDRVRETKDMLRPIVAEWINNYRERTPPDLRYVRGGLENADTYELVTYADVYAEKSEQAERLIPGYAAAMDDIRRFQEEQKTLDEPLRVLDQQIQDLNEQLGEGGQDNRVPNIPGYTETQNTVALNMARFLIDAAERDHTDIAWSDAANRMEKASLPMTAAIKNYDEYLPSAFKRMMKYLGFSDVKLDKLFIGGQGHWHAELTPEMRAAIKRGGLPFMGLVAATMLPSDAKAQENESVDSRGKRAWKTAVGFAAAGMALAYLARHPDLREGLTDRMKALLAAVEKHAPGSPATFYVNPIAPALKQLAKYPSAAALGAVGVVATQSDNKYIQRAGLPVIALAAMSAIGSKRLISTKNSLLSAFYRQLQKTPEGRALGFALSPDRMIDPNALAVILNAEHERALGPARATALARQLASEGPEADRAITDILDNEQWEDVSTMSPAKTTAVLHLAALAEQQLRESEQATIGAGAREPSEMLPNYSGRRLYAHYEAEMASHEPNFPGARAKGNEVRVSQTKHRTLDEPLRQARADLHDAIVTGDPVAIQNAQDALDAATVENYSRRTELGEIRESSRRIPEAIKQNYMDAANMRALTALRQIPGSVHPDWAQAFDDLQAAKQMRKAATTQADKDAAQQLVNEATSRLATTAEEVTRRGQGWVRLPDTRGWGPMRGAVVPKAIAHELQGYSGNSGYQKALTAWKHIKTQFNPGTHSGNILSNIGWAHIKGLPIWDQLLPGIGHKEPYLVSAAKAINSYGRGAKELAEAGVIGAGNASDQGGGMNLGEMNRTEGLEELYRTTRPETRAVLEQKGISDETIRSKGRKNLAKRTLVGAALGAAKGYGGDADTEDEAIFAVAGGLLGALLNGKVRRAIRRTYGSEDDIFKVALWQKMVDGGMSPQKATEYFTSRQSNFGMGRSRSPVINVLASTTHPFIRWTANALPEFATDVIDHPWRYMTLLGAAAAFNEYADEKEGAIPESDIPIGQRRRLGYALPGITHLPFGEDERGGKAAVDVSRWTPMSAVTTGAPPGTVVASIDENAPGIFQPGGPIIDLASKFGANVDPWSGKPFLQRDYPARENIGSLLDAAAGTMLPSVLDIHADRLREDIENRDVDKLKTDALGPSGLKPRYIRPGANAINAGFELKQSLDAMKQDLRLRLRASRSDSRSERIVEQYTSRVQQAIRNFERRLGVPAPREIVDSALTIPR